MGFARETLLLTFSLAEDAPVIGSPEPSYSTC